MKVWRRFFCWGSFYFWRNHVSCKCTSSDNGDVESSLKSMRIWSFSWFVMVSDFIHDLFASVMIITNDKWTWSCRGHSSLQQIQWRGFGNVLNKSSFSCSPLLCNTKQVLFPAKRSFSTDFIACLHGLIYLLRHYIVFIFQPWVWSMINI